MSPVREGGLRAPLSAVALGMAMTLGMAVTLGLPVSGAAQEAISVSPADTAHLPPDTAVRKLLEERIALGRNPGIVVGLMDVDGVRFIAAGSSGRDDLPLDSATAFEAGSITKVLTANLLSLLDLRGVVSLTDPVTTYLDGVPPLRRADGDTVRLADLATHTSGLPRVPGNLAPDDPLDPYADYGADRLISFLYELARTALPLAPAYSNLGSGLLGFVLGRVDGSGYEAALHRHLLDPLAMDDSGFLSDEHGVAARMAQGHSLRGEPTGPWRFRALAGAGALVSTAPDLLRLAAAHLDPADDTLGWALERTLEVREEEGVAPDFAQALGWIVASRDPDDPIVWHNGGTGGFRSFLGMRPRLGTAVVVLTNQSTSVDDLGFHLLDSRRPLAPPPPDEDVPELRLPQSTLERYVGRYRMAPDFVIDVTRDGGTLYAQATGQGRLRLAPVSRSRFRVVGVDATVTFGEDAEGNVDHLILHQAGMDQRAERMEGG